MKKIVYLIASVGFSLFFTAARAGSYEDFFKALQLDHPATVQALLQRGFDPNTVSLDGTPAVIKAMQEQSFKSASVLVADPRLNVDVRNARDETPLMLAALRGQEALVTELVAKGAPVNKSGWTPLHYAATGGHLRVAAFLIGARADVNAESPNGTTPLMMAAMYSHSDMVKLLLESGAEAYLHNDQELTAEDFAIKAGREDSARLIRQVLGR